MEPENRFALSERARAHIANDGVLFSIAGAADYLKLCEACATILCRAELDAMFDRRVSTEETHYLEQLAHARASFQQLFASPPVGKRLSTRGTAPREGYACESCGSSDVRLHCLEELICQGCGHAMTFLNETTTPDSAYDGEGNKISHPPGWDADAQARAEDALATNQQASLRSARASHAQRLALQRQAQQAGRRRAEAFLEQQKRRRV